MRWRPVPVVVGMLDMIQRSIDMSEIDVGRTDRLRRRLSQTNWMGCDECLARKRKELEEVRKIN